MEIHSNLELISKHKDRLEILRQQQAGFGVNCPPHIILEINEISQIIKNLEGTNLEIIDKMYYNLEKQIGYVCHLTNHNPLTYIIRIPLQNKDMPIEVIEIKNTYNSDLTLLTSQTKLAEILYEDAVLYEILLTINANFISGRIGLSGTNVVCKIYTQTILINSQKDLIFLSKVALGTKIAISKIVHLHNYHQELVENEELSKSCYFKWCIDYFYNILKQTTET